MARVQVVHGSKMGGTAEIAERIADLLRHRGLEVRVAAADDAGSPKPFGAVVVGGALYASRWPRSLRRWVTRHAGFLTERPVWFFSSGPLDDSAVAGGIAPTRQVARIMRKAGCTRHRTFGGRLPEDASGFMAKSMARDNAGDWRNWDEIVAWAGEIAESLALVR